MKRRKQNKRYDETTYWTKRAKEIMERTDAQDISSTGEAAVNYIRSGLPLSTTTVSAAESEVMKD
jgi:hypothetical protein